MKIKSLLFALLMSASSLLANPSLSVSLNQSNRVVTVSWPSTNYWFSLQKLDYAVGLGQETNWITVDPVWNTNLVAPTVALFPIACISGTVYTNLTNLIVPCGELYRLKLFPATQPIELYGSTHQAVNSFSWVHSEHAETQEIWRAVDDHEYQRIAIVPGNQSEYDDNLNEDGNTGPYYDGFEWTTQSKFSYVIRGINQLGAGDFTYNLDIYPFGE